MTRFLPPILLLALWAVVLAIFLTPETPHGHGIAHGRIEQMDQGGSGAERHGKILLLGWGFGAVMIAIFVSLLGWGASADPHGPPRRMAILTARGWAFLAGGLMFEGVFAMMCWAYASALADPPSEAFWGPFPRSTAWLLYGIWPVPAVFIALYVLYYDRWILPPAHVERFQKIVRAARGSRR